MHAILIFVIAAPGATLALYVVTRMVESATRAGANGAVKGLAAITILAASISIILLVVGASMAGKMVEGMLDGGGSTPFGNTSEKADVAAMKSDLRTMATYEEQYAADNNGAYFSGTATSVAPLQGFSPSQNVTVTVKAVAGPPPSWSATATNTQTAKNCEMTNGVITCT
jgi:Tfp pilus assembly protein PilE